VEKKFAPTGEKREADPSILDFQTLVQTLAQDKKLSPQKVRAIIKGLADMTTAALKTGKTVKIAGLGVLRVKPARSDTVAKPEKRVVLAPSKQLRAAVNG
jgi:nucleoid DNA-binding protein